MSTRDELAELLEDLDGVDFTQAAGAILERFAVVELPEPDSNGDFLPVWTFSGDDGTEIRVATVWHTPATARVTAAKLLAAANLADEIDGKS